MPRTRSFMVRHTAFTGSITPSARLVRFRRILYICVSRSVVPHTCSRPDIRQGKPEREGSLEGLF
jgi:hypothetical protein